MSSPTAGPQSMVPSWGSHHRSCCSMARGGRGRREGPHSQLPITKLARQEMLRLESSGGPQGL